MHHQLLSLFLPFHLVHLTYNFFADKLAKALPEMEEIAKLLPDLDKIGENFTFLKSLLSSGECPCILTIIYRHYSVQSNVNRLSVILLRKSNKSFG